MTRREFSLTALAGASRVQATAKSDPQRPTYHFLPSANWMNDPNGLIYWNARYHLFYQYNPHGPFWGTMHWGHAVSADLVHWEHLPIALAPTPGGPDKDGVFSGCAVNDNGVPTLIYTGTKPEVQCLATSRDDLTTIQKFSGNPVIEGPPAGLRVTGFRDPWVWKEGGVWLMALGSGVVGKGGAVLLYESPDLRRWRYVHPLFSGDLSDGAPNWECPNFFPLGDKHVLLVSLDKPVGKVMFFTGRYENRKFTPERQGWMDEGGTFYAPQTMLDAEHRRVMFGWNREARSEAAQKEAGWAGIQTVPRVLSLLPDGHLGFAPHPNLQKLRGRREWWRDMGIDDLVLYPGEVLEVLAEIDVGNSQQVGVKLRLSPNEQEMTVVTYDAVKKRLIVDRTKSSLDPRTARDVHESELSLASGETLQLHLFLDRSVIEIYANRRVAMTTRVYPTLDDSSMEFFASGSARMRSLDIWELSEA